MNLTKLLKSTVNTLSKNEISFALAGGLASSIYRKDARLTNDLDIAILIADKSTKDHVLFAQQLIQELNFKDTVIREANLKGGPLFEMKKKTSTPMIIVGRNKDLYSIGLDILLPTLPWVKDAILRSKNNIIDFGICSTPTITVEDLIISKLYAHSLSSTREKDIDDLRSIFEAKHELELDYLVAKMKEHKLMMPKSLKESAPKILNKI
jgi:hypothetical protein